MKVLIVTTSTGWGGLELNVIKLAQELSNKGIDLHFVYQTNTKFEQNILSQFTQRLPLTSVKKYFDFTSAKKIALYIKEHQITTVFTAYRPDLDLLLWAKRKQPFHLVHQQQMQIGPPKKGFFQTLRFNAVDAWLTPLHWLKKEVIEKTKLNENKIDIVPLGVNTTPFLQPQKERSDAQQHFNFQSEKFVIGVLGRIDEKKGQLFLLQALKELLDRKEDVALFIVGEPTVDDPKSTDYYQNIQSFIHQNKLESSVFFAPFTKDVFTFYQAIDLFVMSSEGETFGMVTVEALFSKTPVIGTNSSGTPEVLGYGKRGALYTYNSIDSFVDAYFKIRKKLQTKELDLTSIQQESMELYSLEKEVAGVLEHLR